ncbi:MAG TPA: RidA family protein [Kofleriaceae bacterium]|nr:RidA family protein [Kofleriaceae bacterium]
MPLEFIVSDEITPPQVPLSHAVKCGNLVFVSGVHPMRQDRSVAPDFRSQMIQVMTGLQAILAQAGTSLDRVIKTNVILVRTEDYREMNEIYRSYFAAGRYPARTTIVAGLAREDLLLEIECVAELP